MAAYARSDFVRFTFKPMNCAENDKTDPTESQLFIDYCVDFSQAQPTKPVVMVNSAYVNFNITNEATFENINFEGNDNLAFYQESSNNGKPVEEFPVQLCNQTISSGSHHSYEVASVTIPSF